MNEDMSQIRPEPNSLLTRFAASMRAKGLKEIGAGAMALVFQSDKTDEVVKVFRHDECYVEFLKMIANNKNDPHLPVINEYQALKQPPYNGLHIVKMEKLIKVAGIQPYEDACYKLYKYFGLLNKGQRIPEDVAKEHKAAIAEKLKALPKDNSSLLKTIDILSEVPRRCTADLHNQNIMRRENGTLVIIDPYV